MKGVHLPTAASEDERDELDPSEVHDVLRNDRRRMVLERLYEADTPETVRELSEHIAGIEAGERPPPRNVRQSVYVSLHQTHLPKLDELGIVEYDADAKEVRLAEHAHEVTVYLEVVERYELSWGEYYLGIGLFGLLLLAARSVDVPFLAAVDPLLLAAVPLALTVASAGYHVYTQKSTLFDRLRE